MIGVILLIVSFALVLRCIRTLGFLAPTSVFSQFAFACLLTFYIVHLFQIQKKDVIFSSMPMPDFVAVAPITMLYYSLLVAFGWIASIGIHAPRVAGQRISLRPNRSAFEPAINGKWAAVILIGIVAMTAIHFLEIDKSLLWHNHTYLLIKDPEAIGITSTIGRVYHFLFRIFGLVCLPLAIYYFKRRNSVLFVLSAIISAYSIIFLLAGNSRWVPLYFFCALAFNLQLGRKPISMANLLLLLLAFISFLKVLIGRNQDEQGVSQIFHDISLISFEMTFQYIGGFIINVMQGAIGFANSVLIEPKHDQPYRLLSFSPFISAIDGFNQIREDSEVRIHLYVPMSAFSEVWHFGFIYLTIFYTILLLCLRYSTIVFLKFGGAASVIISTPTYWLIFTLHQYSLRTTWRFVIIIAIAAWVLNRLHNRRTRRAGVTAAVGAIARAATMERRQGHEISP